MGELKVTKHVDYIKSLDKKKDFDSLVTEHLRMSGAYWGLTAMDLMGQLTEMEEEAIVSWLLQCQHDSGGFSGNIDHDPHILYTLSAVQILALYDRLEVIDKDKIAAYISQLQQDDGSFAGDEWGEIDTRFSYCAICCLSLLKCLDKIDLKKAVEFVACCKNFDGGFGCTPGGESHAGQIFCCVGALAIAGALHHVDKDLLGWWLCERQVQSGGLNGRPEKLPDVCYSWWVLSSLVLIDRVHWIDKDKLKQFILDCQEGPRLQQRACSHRLPVLPNNKPAAQPFETSTSIATHVIPENGGVDVCQPNLVRALATDNSDSFPPPCQWRMRCTVPAGVPLGDLHTTLSFKQRGSGGTVLQLCGQAECCQVGCALLCGQLGSMLPCILNHPPMWMGSNSCKEEGP